MSLNPGQPDATTTGLFPIPPGPARNKLRQKYRALTDAIRRTWEATATSDVELHDGHFLVDCEQVVNDAATALAIARTIDTLFMELITDTDKVRYEQMWTDDPDARIVRGLVLIRNAEIHAHTPIEIDSPRLVSGFGKNGWRVFPRWQEYADLPGEIQNNAKTGRTAHDRYRDSVGGRLVIETLLDALRFFDRCDPSLTRRADNGDIEGFPLEMFIEHSYERRHPYWPSGAEMNEQLLDRFTIMAPTGAGREIRRAIPVDGTTVYVGFTRLGPHNGFMSFLESAEQIAWDIAGGYPYTAVTKSGEPIPVTLIDGTLRLEGVPLTDVDPADTAVESSDRMTERSDEDLTSRWKALLSDAFRYRPHRRPAGPHDHA
jgi:hypothetical protein